MDEQKRDPDLIEDVDEPVRFERTGESSLSLPGWLADESDDDAESDLRLPDEAAFEDEAVEEESGAPMVATAWIDRSATRALTESAALFALVASQARGVDQGGSLPALAPVVARPVTEPPDEEAELASDRRTWFIATAAGVVAGALILVIVLWLLLS